MNFPHRGKAADSAAQFCLRKINKTCRDNFFFPLDRAQRVRGLQSFIGRGGWEAPIKRRNRHIVAHYFSPFDAIVALHILKGPITTFKKSQTSIEGWGCERPNQDNVKAWEQSSVGASKIEQSDQTDAKVKCPHICTSYFIVSLSRVGSKIPGTTFKAVQKKHICQWRWSLLYYFWMVCHGQVKKSVANASGATPTLSVVEHIDYAKRRIARI